MLDPQTAPPVRIPANSPNKDPVAIVGGGPTGLTLGVLLARAGVTVDIYEASLEPDARPRAVMLHARAMEILANLGLSDIFLATGLMQESIAFQRDDGLRLAIDFAGLPTQFPGVLNLRQPEIEGLLENALRAYGGRIHRGVTLTGLQQGGSHVKAELRRVDGTLLTGEAAWLFGCDGAHSTVRRLLGVPFIGHTCPFLYLLGEGRCTAPQKAGSVSTMFITADSVVSWLPFRDGSVRVAGPGDASSPTPPVDSKKLPSLTIGSFLEKQAKFMGDAQKRISIPDRAAYYKVHTRMAHTWGSGRVWLAGDAAHVHPPAGGQAINLGMGDAEAISLHLTGGGCHYTPGFNSYQSERQLVAEATMDLVAMMPLVDAIRRASSDSEIDALRSRLSHMAVQLSHLYTDYSAVGASCLGSADTVERHTIRLGRRVDARTTLLAQEDAPACWRIAHRPDVKVWLTADRHVRHLESSSGWQGEP